MNDQLVPLGKITVAAAGTPVSLAVNSGNLMPTAGQLQVTALRGLLISADAGNTKNVYLVPSGDTASGNAGSILLALAPGQSAFFPPPGVSLQFYPEQLSVDADTSGGIAYACGFRD